mmetsp:Transcript_25452/g.59272  ORF Transcript_25452/g.59272 Transcript_25452/m.59272 type:complete len:215 (+) Transcript_25452:127-771(+)
MSWRRSARTAKEGRWRRRRRRRRRRRAVRGEGPRMKLTCPCRPYRRSYRTRASARRYVSSCRRGLIASRPNSRRCSCTPRLHRVAWRTLANGRSSSVDGASSLGCTASNDARPCMPWRARSGFESEPLSTTCSLNGPRTSWCATVRGGPLSSRSATIRQRTARVGSVALCGFPHRRSRISTAITTHGQHKTSGSCQRWSISRCWRRTRDPLPCP